MATHESDTLDVGYDGMLAVLKERVRRAHGMTVDEYVGALRAGTLKRVPGDTALEVFAGDLCAREPEETR